jgi:Flp pilus assembly protein TadG
MTRSSHPRKGAVAVEAAVVLIPFCLLLLGVVEYGRYMMMRQLLVAGAREGARRSVVSSRSLTDEDIRVAVKERLAGQKLEGLSITVRRCDRAGKGVGDWNEAALNEPLSVQVSGIYRPMVPTLGILPRTLPMSTRVVMRNEVP